MIIHLTVDIWQKISLKADAVNEAMQKTTIELLLLRVLQKVGKIDGKFAKQNRFSHLS